MVPHGRPFTSRQFTAPPPNIAKHLAKARSDAWQSSKIAKHIRTFRRPETAPQAFPPEGCHRGGISANAFGNLPLAASKTRFLAHSPTLCATLACIAIAPLLTACNMPAIQVYTALRAYGPGELQVGDQFRDFGFADSQGQVTRLSAVKGRVTILAFSGDPNWPDCDTVERLAELAADASTCWIDVVVVSVGHPLPPCPDALPAAADCTAPPGRLVLVCDPFDKVAALYGRDAPGHYYVLTNFLKIAATGELTDLDTLRAATRRVVADIYDQDLREGAYDWHRGDRW